MSPQILAVHLNPKHQFSKESTDEIKLVAGHGVRGDAHFGVTVKHRSRVAKDPFQPNLRQVHLLQSELLGELLEQGLSVEPGAMGENITTCGIDLLGLATGARLSLGHTAVVEITGLRNPCAQIEKFKSGLLAAVLGRTQEGALVRKAGVMGVVVEGGVVRPGDAIRLLHTPEVFSPLQPV